MPAAQSAALADFARTCKAAARAVSLYPGSHPAIATTLGRLVTAVDKLAHGGDVTLLIHPTALVIDDRAPARPDPSIGELAALLHSRLIGSLRVQVGAGVEDWRQFLLVLARPIEDLLAEGGPATVWTATGRGHFDIIEIDYAAVLKERSTGDDATWDKVLASCLKGEALELDDTVIEMLLSAFGDAEELGGLLDRLNEKADAERSSVPARVATVIQLLKAVLSAAEARGQSSPERILGVLAQSSPHFTPDMILGLLAHKDSSRADEAQLAGQVIDRMTDASIASFVARSVTAERGASARLAHAFEALVPDVTRRSPLLELAHDEARAGESGQDPRFEEMWSGATRMMLETYSDEGWVSDDYARELTSARTQAIEVERLSDDPPERLAEWLSTINDRAIRELDLSLTLDLLRIESSPETWAAMATLATRDLEQRAMVGDVGPALQLAEALATTVSGDRHELRGPAQRALHLVAGPLTRHVTGLLRKASDVDSAAVARLCHTVGPVMVKALAEALAAEDHLPTIRRLKEVLIGFGAPGRDAVELLRNSTNPAVRRTAIDLLRVFGGNEALRELTAMLNDADPQVKQDSLRAIVQIGTREAYTVLERACAADERTRAVMITELLLLRDPKTIPPLCHELTATAVTGATAAQHEAIIDALGSLRAHRDSTAALQTALHRGTWWAPMRTARLRHAAARALRRLGSADARAVLEEAVRVGNRGVRNAAAAELSSFTSTGAGA